MKLALVTHAEHPKLRGTMPDIWPEFMAHDPVIQSFWPQLYDQYPDFQLWVVDRENRGRRTVAYACSVPVAWNGNPSPRGVDWALTDGVEGTPTTLCAIVAPAPISTGAAPCTIAPSWMLAPARTTIGAKSPRSTAPYQTEAPASTVTSPTMVAVGAMNASG